MEESFPCPEFSDEISILIGTIILLLINININIIINKNIPDFLFSEDICCFRSTIPSNSCESNHKSFQILFLVFCQKLLTNILLPFHYNFQKGVF